MPSWVDYSPPGHDARARSSCLRRRRDLQVGASSIASARASAAAPVRAGPRAPTSCSASAWQLEARIRNLEVVGQLGVTNLNVWLRTLTFAMVCAICGMWQPTHSLPGAVGAMMRVRLDARRVRAVRRARAVAGQAQLLGRLQQIGVVRRAVRVVAAEAGHAARVHQALDEVVALHPVLVRRAVGEVRERRLAELVLLELPEVLQVEPDAETRPASRSTARRSDSAAAGPASGTGCRCRWPSRCRAAPD